MSPKAIQLIVPLVLIIHGIGHFMGIVPAAGLFSNPNWHARSWLLTDLIVDQPTRAISITLWLVLGIGFILAGAGAFGWEVTQGSWRTITLVLSVLSLIAIILFWNSFAAIHNKLGAILVNIAALVCILGLNWPSTDIIP
jgi:hypothetical protein